MSHDYTQPNSFGEDSVDHINISSRPGTQLGKLFDPSYYRIVYYPEIGKFGSVMNLWHWLRSDPLSDVYRRATGEKLRNELAKSKAGVYVPNFRAIIAHATYKKLEAYPNLIEELRKLPPEIKFASYYVPRNAAVRVCSSYANVIVPIAEMIREAVVKDETPDFASLIQSTENFDNCLFLPFLKQRFPETYEEMIKAAELTRY